MIKPIALFTLGVFIIVGSIWGGSYVGHIVPNYLEFAAGASTFALVVIGIVVCAIGLCLIGRYVETHP